MDYNRIITELSRNGDTFQSMLTGLSEAEYMWRPSEEKWCLLEIVCHIYDEEREDFRARTKHVLENPKLPMPPIDPVGWVKERKYIEQDYFKMLSEFQDERGQSTEWLQSLIEPSWDNVYNHPKFGLQSAKMFLCNWLAHDYFHFRQITRLKFAYLKHTTGESLKYAGDW